MQAPLPPGVEEILGELHSVTPGITCLVLQFVLDEDTSRAVNHAFDATLTTRLEHIPMGWAYIGPAQQRSDLVVAERRRLRDSCHRWMSEHLPAAFSAGIAAGGVPTVETFVDRH